MSSSDYIVVGGGQTGTALAVRLSEDPTVTVTILEAGGDTFHDENIDTPAYLVNNLGHPNKDWAFFSTPQAALGNRPVFLPRGKMIGGSSLLNFMVVNRASAPEYDSFAKLGSDGWTWKDLLPYFVKSETLEYTEEQAARYGAKIDSKYNGTSGPVRRSLPRSLGDVAKPWIDAVKEIGIPYNSDPNDGSNTGVWVSTSTVDGKGQRSSAASAYYEPNSARSNLKLVTGARATKVLTTTKDGVVIATGVEYLKDGETVTIHATKEVIMSAGAYQTPQLLELSGIGDPTVLSKHNIPVVIELPGVGNNLQEHITATFTAKLKPGHTTWENMADPKFAEAQAELYKTTGGGMLSALPSAFAFLPIQGFDHDGSIVNSAANVKITSRTLAEQKEWLKNPEVPFLELSAFDRFMPGKLAAPEPGANYMSSSAILLHPFSRGSCHIASNDPATPPLIDINFLDNDTDIKMLVRGYETIRKIIKSSPFKEHIEVEVSPGEDVKSDEEIIEYLRKTVGTTYHPIATASMLPKEDGGCVDKSLKVYGTKNLRVVDASIIPIHISAHLQATLYAIAEKAADIIKADK